MRFGDRLPGFFIVLLALAALPLRAASTTSLQMDIGWGNHTRQGIWTPVFVRVSDTKTRAAYLELYAPHDSSSAMSIRMPIALGPSTQTYVLYAPLLNYGDAAKLKVIDAASGKTLIEQVLLDPYGDDGSSQRRNVFDYGDGVLIGVSGRGPAMGQLQVGSLHPLVLYLEPELLPRTPKGFDGLYVLALNQPDFNQLETAQQTAICDWVRGGGRLVLWPGEAPIPPNSPLVQLLPCKIGDVTTVTLSPVELQAARLQPRFAKFKGRILQPREGAISFKLIGDNGRVVRDRVGLGDVTVVSFEASGLDFGSTNDTASFWGKILDPAYSGTGTVASDWARSRSGSNSNQIQDSQRAAAAGRVMDLLGNVPGVGTFGFGYVAAVLLGMMVIVGPVDWFVLKRLGRQPWTWVTTLGWIGLVTTGALFMGYAFRSGDLHERTMRIIDQADDQVVSRLDVVGIYSPRTTDYSLETGPGGWWEPLTSNEYGYGRGTVMAIPFRQDGRGNSGNIPQEMTINVWNLRFLFGETIAPAPPVIAASIGWKNVKSKVTQGVSEPRIVGTITNLTDAPLSALWLRSQRGVYDLSKQPGFPAGGLAPGVPFSIDLALANNQDWSGAPPKSNSVTYNRYGRPHVPVEALQPLDIVKSACELPTRQGREVELMISGSPFNSQTAGRNFVAIYAIGETSTPAAKLRDQQPIEKHWQVLRAVVAVKHADAP